MPKGLVRSDPNHGGDSYRNGFAVVEPLEFNTPITEPHVFGTEIPVADRSLAENLVTWAPSPAHFGNIVAPPAAATPTFSPVAGEYATAQDVTITSAGSDAIYYTTDGSTPTTGSTLYTVPVHVATSETLKAIATKSGKSNSAVGSAAYVIDAVAKSFVQAKFGPEFNSAAPAVSFDAPTTAGNCILVYSQLFGASNHVISSVTDDGGNTYVKAIGPDNSPADGFGAGCWRQIWVAFNAAPATAITSNITSGGTGMICVAEVAGCTAVDATHFNVVLNAVTLDAGSIDTTVDGDLLVDFMGFMLGSAGHPYDTTGIIPDWIVQGQGSGVTQIGENMMVQTQVAGAAGTYTIQASVFPAAGTGGTGGSSCLALK